MSYIHSQEVVGTREDRLLMMLERLLEFPMHDVNSTLDWATQLVTEALGAEIVVVFLHESATDSLVAHSHNDSLGESQQHIYDLHRLPIVNGGYLVEVFLTGVPYITSHAGHDAEELVRMGMKSEVATVFEVGTQHRGVLVAFSTLHQFFSEQDLLFLQAVASWLGIMIHRAELVKRARQEAVEQGRRLAAEELLTIMSHDLRNYLTPLKGRLDLIERRARREGRAQDLHDITAAFNTFNLLGRVISDLLDVARLNQGIFTIHPQHFNLMDLVYELVPAFSGPETPIHVLISSNVEILADPDRIRQVLENLLTNAIKYAPEHTTITVRVSKERRIDGVWILLEVNNEGPGIPPELCAQFLRPFVAGSTSTGLGLGLYLANRIAEAHYGTLKLDSPCGQGVRVTLALPMEEENLGGFNH